MRVFFTLPNEAEAALNDAPRSESAAAGGCWGLLGLCRPMAPYKSKSLAGLTLDYTPLWSISAMQSDMKNTFAGGCCVFVRLLGSARLRQGSVKQLCIVQ